MPDTTNDSSDIQAAVALLSRYCERADVLRAHLCQKQSIVLRNRSQIAEAYRSFKGDLEGDLRRLTKKQSEGQLADFEKAFLLPAVHEASCGLTAAANSNPVKSNWYEAVDYAGTDLGHACFQLRELLEA